MARRRRFTGVKVNTKLILDVIGASLIVQQAPKLLSGILPTEGFAGTAVGTGVGYVAGMVFKRADLSNASIALGVVDIVGPMIEGMIGPGGGVPGTTGALPSGAAMPPIAPGADADVNRVADYYRLNEYTNSPGARLPYTDYINTY